jgi:hypothetical protein
VQGLTQSSTLYAFTMDLDALDRLINDACTPSPLQAIRRTSRIRQPSSESVCTITPNAMTSAPPVGIKKHTTCSSPYRSILYLLLRATLLGIAVKIMKPDFCLPQSHSHGQSRFLRGNNVLLSESPFRPRFIEDIYGSDNEADKDELFSS